MGVLASAASLVQLASVAKLDGNVLEADDVSVSARRAFDVPASFVDPIRSSAFLHSSEHELTDPVLYHEPTSTSVRLLVPQDRDRLLTWEHITPSSLSETNFEFPQSTLQCNKDDALPAEMQAALDSLRLAQVMGKVEQCEALLRHSQ